MKAQLLQTYGDTPDFRLADTDVPAVKPGHVLVRVAATSVNPIDIKIRKLKPIFAPVLPAILGMDVAGVVEAVGEGVSGFRPGDEVFGCAGGLADMPGALAEYMLADARLLALKPANLSMLEAATLPLVTITAWQALFDRAKITAGQSVLIHAGTGGVGHVAVQLAKSCGARVTATVSSADKAELARSLGADEIVNYREEKPKEYVARLTGGRGFDVVFDTVGGANLDASFLAAATDGVVVTTNTRSTHDLSPLHAKALTLSVVFMPLPLITGIGRERHDEVAQAQDFVDSGQALGKVAIRVV